MSGVGFVIFLHSWPMVAISNELICDKHCYRLHCFYSYFQQFGLNDSRLYGNFVWIRKALESQFSDTVSDMNVHLKLSLLYNL